MKLRVKVALGLLLALFAAMSLAAVLGSLGVVPAAAEGEPYLLREYQGNVAVFRPDSGERPVQVTDIRVAELPMGDRAELAAGVSASDYGAVVRLLEDYGA